MNTNNIAAVMFLVILAFFSLAALTFSPSYYSKEKVLEREEKRTARVLEKKKKEDERLRIEEEKRVEVEAKIAEVNAGDTPISFDRLYYRNKVRGVKRIQELTDAFEDDFKENFRNCESKMSKSDIFDIKEDYELKVRTLKVDGVWKYRIEVVSILNVNYQRSFYYLGNEEYKKKLGVVEFELIPWKGKIELGNGKLL